MSWGLQPFGQEVTERFGLGPLLDVAEAGRGAMGQIWRVRTASDDVAVKQTFWPVEADVLDGIAVREVAFVELARTAGVVAPRQRADRTGRFAVATSVGVVRVADWVAGEHVARDDRDAARWAGWVLATLTGLDFRTSPDEVDPWYTTAPSEERWEGLVATARSAGADWAAVLSRQAPDLMTLGSLVDGGRGPLPVAWSHTDIQAQNILRRPDGGYELIDWDDAGPVVPVYALARLIMDWCVDPVAAGDSSVDAARVDAARVDAARVTAVLDGYRSAGGVEIPTEMTHYSGLVAGTLNFLAWQIVLALGLDPALGSGQPADGPAHAQVRRLLSDPLRPGTLSAVARAVRDASA